MVRTWIEYKKVIGYKQLSSLLPALFREILVENGLLFSVKTV
jgi:hypothetical protein